MEKVVESYEETESVGDLSDQAIVEDMVHLRRVLGDLRGLVQVKEARLIALGKEKTRREVARFEAAGKVKKVVVSAEELAKGERWKRA